MVRSQTRIRIRCGESGIALLIAIFILLLISVVAVALIVSSGTETALAGNYRSSTSVYYAASAGLEEVRARLHPNYPNSFKNTAPANFLPPTGTPFGMCTPSYVLNPALGETVTPWASGSTYFDSEFVQELGTVCGGVTAPPSSSPNTLSIWKRSPLNSLSFPGPLYKWVRINGITEQALYMDTSPYDTTIDPTLIYYTGTNLNDTNSGNQVLEVTALAVLPNGSQKILQYLIAAQVISLPIPPPAALTILGGPGHSVSFNAPTDPGYNVRGNDQDTVGSCSPGGPIPAIGVLTNPDKTNVVNGIPTANQPGYTGSTSAPSVQVVGGSFPANLQTPAGLEALAQSIMQNADVTITPSGGPATGSNLPSAMYTPSPNPMTVVVNGDLDLTGWNQTGYGLLLVRGNLNYDPNATWDGIVLVIGQGTVTGGAVSGGGDIDGTVLIAKTLDNAGNILSSLGTGSFNLNSNLSGEGIHYSSCWTKAAQPYGSIKIISFHEISQ